MPGEALVIDSDVVALTTDDASFFQCVVSHSLFPTDDDTVVFTEADCAVLLSDDCHTLESIKVCSAAGYLEPLSTVAGPATVAVPAIRWAECHCSISKNFWCQLWHYRYITLF